MSNVTHRVLVASPIHQKPSILMQFLHSLNEQHYKLDFYFIDDNSDERSRQLLTNFKSLVAEDSHVIIEPSFFNDEYIRNDNRHFWNNHLIWKVARFKDRMIDYAKNEGYDYLFLIDSDLLLHPNVISHLLDQKKDIISEIFWTKWNKDSLEEPQVWLMDEYTQVNEEYKGKSDLEKYVATMDFYRQLKEPGIFKVGGLGACTLISKKALDAGVRFERIYNLSFWGEDRHFCIRAAALGLELFVDTHYPAYHIYREANLDGVESFKRDNGYTKSLTELGLTTGLQSKKVTLSMIVKNEEHKYLRQVLEHAAKYIDNAVIIDDHSTDRTKDIIREVLGHIPLILIENTESKFSREFELRQQQWNETIKTSPDWILNLDADEVFEDKFIVGIKELIHTDDIYLYSFRLYDFWNQQQYREDNQWRAHLYYRPFLLRYDSNFQYSWNLKNQHCGRFPANIYQLPNKISDYRVKHFGWANEEVRAAKYKRYMELDPGGKDGDLAQYESILDENPVLIDWVE